MFGVVFATRLNLSFRQINWVQKWKVTCTKVQAFRLCTGRSAYRGSTGTALPFHDHGTRRGEGSASRPGRSLPGQDPVPIVQEAGWDPGPVWTCEENLTPTGIRSPERPARSQSPYRLRYLAHQTESKVAAKTAWNNLKMCPTEEVSLPLWKIYSNIGEWMCF
jgi:hypothetical protein